jgi:dUTP pyrophosphatase
VIHPYKAARLVPEAVIPIATRDGDAGRDLVAIEEVVLIPRETALVRTGIALELPIGMCALVVPRSGLAVRYGVTVLNAPGLIDSGYRGEVKVALINHGHEAYRVRPGDRIAQLVLMLAALTPFHEVEAGALQSSDRGEQGFGSTGR